MADQREYLLKWKEHDEDLVKIFKQMLDRQAFADVTIACEGKFIKAHKLILAACSDYLNDILEENTSKDPIIFLPQLKYNDIKALIDYMYCGETIISYHRIPSLLEAAQVLCIKGLINATRDDISNSDSPGTSATLDRDNRAINRSLQSLSPPINLQDPRLFEDLSISTMQQQLASIMGRANGFPQLTGGESNDNMENLPAAKKARRLRPSAPRSKKNIIATMQKTNLNNNSREHDQVTCDGAGPSSGTNDRYSVDLDRLSSAKVKGDPYCEPNDCDADDKDDLHDRTNNNDSVLDNDEQDEQNWTPGLSHHYDDDADDYEQSHLPINPEVSFDDCSTGDPANGDESNEESQNKTFVCHLCRLTFTAQSSLRRHMHRHYSDRERFECEICHNSYSRKDYLKEHKKTKHQIMS